MSVHDPAPVRGATHAQRATPNDPTTPMREAIVPPSRRGAARAYSPAVAFGDLIFTSGLTAADPVSGAIPTGIEAQTRRCFEKLDDILQAGGSSLGQVLRVTVYLTDVAAQQAPMTAVYREVFPADPPARTTVQVAALSSPDKLIEIEAIAARTPEGSR